MEKKEKFQVEKFSLHFYLHNYGIVVATLSELKEESLSRVYWSQSVCTLELNSRLRIDTAVPECGARACHGP